MDQLYPINNYWEQARTLYAPFECTATMKAGTTAVIKHTRVDLFKRRPSPDRLRLWMVHLCRKL
jgi:hypothetical protein